MNENRVTMARKILDLAKQAGLIAEFYEGETAPGNLWFSLSYRHPLEGRMIAGHQVWSHEIRAFVASLLRSRSATDLPSLLVNPAVCWQVDALCDLLVDPDFDRKPWR